MKQEQVAAINKVLDGLPPGTPVMLAGYSQGGMDAQILAHSNLTGMCKRWSHTDRPSSKTPGSGYTTVHLQDSGDIVPKTFNPVAEINALSDGDVFVGNSQDDALGPGVAQGAIVHMDPTTYQEDGTEFDAAPGYDKAKSVMDQFLRGQVVDYRSPS